MDRRERVYDPDEALRMALDARALRIWTALPATVTKFNRALGTLEAQPAINGSVRQPDGTFLSIQMPKVVDVPVLWPGGGGMTMVFDVAAGDECLIHFSARCIDAWWATGYQAATAGTGIGADGKAVNPANDPPLFRMHSLSDGFASVGLRSLPRALAADPGVCRIRTDDDMAYLEFNPTTKTMKAVFSGGVTINGVTFDSSGNVVSPATVTGTTQVVAGTGGSAVHLTTHVHPAGTPNTGVPVPGS